MFILCDASTNYIYNFDIYTGKKDKPTKDLGGSVVKDLIKGLENKGHVLYIDSFYTSIPLLRDLEKMMFGCTGAIMKNRKGLPPNVKNKKLEKTGVFISNLVT